MKTLIFCLIISLTALAQEIIAPGQRYEIVSWLGNRMEVKDTYTGAVVPYLLSDSSESDYPVTTDTGEPRQWYYLVRVAQLPWYFGMISADADKDGRGEIYCAEGFTGIMHRYAFRYPWVFEHHDYGIMGVVYDFGDPDADGRTDILISDSSSEALIESRSSDGYPDTIVWRFNQRRSSFLDDKLGDLDNDGWGEVLFYTLIGNVGYEIREAIGDNQYQFKTMIRFSDYVHDFSGEPSWGDIDGDGRNEVFAGGIHGEIIVFENVADDSFEFIWQGYAGAPNAYSTEFLGDTDGDGRNEFMVGAKGGGYRNSIWEAIGDNQYEMKFMNVQTGDSWGDSDIELADFDGDGAEEIAICTNESLSMLKNFGDDDWRRVLQFHTGSRAADMIKFKADSTFFPCLVTFVRSPFWTTNIFQIGGVYIPGDVNGSGILSGPDLLYLVAYLDGDIVDIAEPYWRADANGDCQVDWADVTYLLNYFKGHNPAPIPGWCHLYIQQ